MGVGQLRAVSDIRQQRTACVQFSPALANHWANDLSNSITWGLNVEQTLALCRTDQFERVTN